jgi:hypothetical protein
MEDKHQLVVRRRRDDGHDHSKIWLGYDEYVGHKATGKIVLGWKYVDGETIYEYAEFPPENIGITLNGMTPDQLAYVEDIQANAGAPIDETFPVRQLEYKTRYRCFFRMCGGAGDYGLEDFTKDTVEEIVEGRKWLEQKYRGFTFTDWSVRMEHVMDEELSLEAVWPDSLK